MTVETSRSKELNWENIKLKMDNGECLICSSGIEFKQNISRCESCETYISNFSSGSGTGVDGLKSLRLKNYTAISKSLHSIADPKSMDLIEIGSSSGLFLEFVTNKFKSVQGLEPEIEKARIAQQTGQKTTIGYFPEDLPEQKYDVICFNDVFEHLPDPIKSIKACEESLRPDGLLVVNIPLSDGYIFQLSRFLKVFGLLSPWNRMWQRGLSSPHITYFSKNSFYNFVLENTNLKLEKFEPLDSFAVEGSWSRIRSTEPLIFSIIYFVPLIVISLVQRFLPRDIGVFYFRKANS